jgi:hypothetical protein
MRGSVLIWIPVRIDLLAILLFEAKEKLDWWEISLGARRRVRFRGNQLLLWRDEDLRSDFKNVHGLGISIEDGSTYRLLAINVLLHDTVLENTHSLQNVQSSGIARVNSVKNKSDDNFLPSRRITIPKT